jgi:4-oxalocrotonate tautomerase
MPVVTISTRKGKDTETKLRLIKKVTDAVVDAIQARPEDVTVLIYEVEKDAWGKGGKFLG